MSDVEREAACMGDEVAAWKQEREFLTSHGWLPAPRVTQPDGRRRKANGGRPRTESCHVYVAHCPGISRVKVGISGQVMRRMTSLEAEAGAAVHLVLARMSVTTAAVEIERMALEHLRANPGTEWAAATPDEAVAAVLRAFDQVAGMRRVDPFVTDDEARKARIFRLQSNVV